jgi:glycosyltransferase involved in cell wall biosynthesis
MYVHPAEMELEGISCLEAIVCGKLTIVSDSPLSATRQFAASEKCIFRHGDPKSLALAIDYFIEHPEERRRHEQLYLEKSCRYEQDVCMQQMETMMKEVCNGKKNA